jgi:hypothetical protein
MPRKKPFLPEPDTEPDLRRSKVARPESGPAPKGTRERSEAPTEPPPPSKSSAAKPARVAPRVAPSGPKPARHSSGAATVDEVTADLSKDPRSERDGDE